MRSSAAFQTGQTLFLETGDARQPLREITVSRVGRKWVYFDRDLRRFDILTMSQEGYYDTNVYFSREQYEESVLLRNAWKKLRQKIERLYRVPEHLTLKNLQMITKLLGIPLDEKD